MSQPCLGMCLRNTHTLEGQSLSRCHWRRKLVVVLSSAFMKEKKLSRCVVPGIAASHLPAAFSCQLLLLMQLWSKQLRALFSTCWCVIDSEIPLCPKGSWLLGQGSLYPANGNSKCLRGHMERESWALFVRSAICWWETLGDRGCKGVREGWWCRAAWHPSASSSFYCGMIHPAHSRRRLLPGTGGQGCWESVRDTQMGFSQFNCRNWKSSKMEEAHFRPSFLEKSTINKFA